MISCPTVKKSVIRSHYDLATVFYRLLWGPHIHHGLWDANGSQVISDVAAQLCLTKTLAQEANIAAGDRIIDVGCGMGGSSIYLAENFHAEVIGITISAFQQWWASASARFHAAGSRVKFIHQDAELAEFSPQSFDIVWSVECTEHLFDKAAFFRRASTWLAPGGRMAICAWLSTENPNPGESQQLHDVCEGFFCPSLGSRCDYQEWMEAGNLTLLKYHDWSERVWKTWQICRDRMRRTGMQRIAPFFNSDMVMFLNRFDTILNAYQTGAMKYGCFIAQKPS